MDKRNKKRSKSISMKLTQYKIFVSTSILPSFCLIVILFLFFINQTIQYHKQEYNNTLNILSTNLLKNVYSYSDISLSYLFDTDISAFYSFLDSNIYNSQDNYSTYIKDLSTYNKSICSYMTLVDDNILGIGFIPCNKNKNTMFYIEKFNNLDVIQNYKYRNTRWYQYLSQNKHSVIFTNENIKSDEAAETHITMVRLVKNIDSNYYLGYIKVDISMKFLSDLLRGVKIGKNSGILLMSPQNELLYSTSSNLSDCSDLLDSNQKQIRYNGHIYDIYSLSDIKYGFTFYFMSSRKDFLQIYQIAFLYAMAAYICIILIASALFSYISKNISKSINPILSTMSIYHAGNSKIQCDIDICSIKEIRIIAEYLNQMINNINNHIDNEYRLQIQQKTAEYFALQSQINPHFLYNVLNMFITINRMGDKATLEKSIIALSKLFRYTCEQTKESTILQEFNFIQEYLYLEQIRYDDRLNFTIHADSEIENFKIPKMLIQPLVENAIVHGLEPIMQPVNIQINAGVISSRNQISFLYITVINDGAPFDFKEDKENKKVGLANVKDRLQLLYPLSFFFIKGGSGRLTECWLLIPYHK